MINSLKALSTFFKLKVNSSRAPTHLCVGCLSPTRATGMCFGCVDDLPWNQSACARCALPLATSIPHPPGMLCGPCLSQPPAFDKVVAPWLYSFPVNGMIGHFKYGKQRAFGRPLTELLARHIVAGSQTLPACMIPVPMHASRQRERGFNQAEEIALWLADRLPLPVAAHLVSRRKLGESQSGLTRRQRLINLKATFEVTGPVPKHVALVDDVVTTGATAQEIAQRLKKAGAVTVDIWALARTPKIPH